MICVKNKSNKEICDFGIKPLQGRRTMPSDAMWPWLILIIFIVLLDPSG